MKSRNLLLITLFIFFILFILFLDIWGKSKVLIKYKAVFDALYFGELMKKKNLVLEGCTYPDLQKNNKLNFLQPKNYSLINDHAKCLNKSELISIRYEFEGYALATFSCKENDMVIEYSWANYQQSCNIVEMKKIQYQPLIYTITNMNSP